MKFSKREIIFFLVIYFFLFIGCGVPNYFYLGSSYYNFGYTNPKPNQIDVHFKANDSEQTKKIENGSGMSLFLMYVISDDSTNSGFRSELISRFKNKTKASDIMGSQVSINDSSLTQTVGDIYEYTVSENSSEKKKYALRIMRPDMTSTPEGFTFSVPTYHLVAKDDSNSEINCSIIYDNATGKIELLQKMSPNDIEGIAESKYNLTRCEGKLWNELPNDWSDYETNFKDKSGHSDLTAFSQSSISTGIYLHIFGACCAGKGTMSNVFWVPLKDLGTIKLK